MFDGTNTNNFFEWWMLVNSPLSVMMFGPPLSSTRPFNNVFGNASDASTLHHRFVNMYDEFVGDINACLGLYNSYVYRQLVAAEKKVKDMADSQRQYDSEILKSRTVVDFLERVDECCERNLTTVFTKFKNHAEPIIPTQDFQSFVDEADIVFGDLWTLLAEIRGVKPNQKAEEEQN